MSEGFDLHVKGMLKSSAACRDQLSSAVLSANPFKTSM